MQKRKDVHNNPHVSTASKSPVVREANDAARARFEPRPSSLWERRIVNHFISLNGFNDDEFKEHTISVAEVEKYLGYPLGSKEYAEIRNTVKRLIRLALIAPSGTRGINLKPR